MASTNISANKLLNTYNLFNATDIKSFIIKQLTEANNPVFKDADYLGSNLNAFIDIIAVMLQQILFNFSLNASETAFSTASLYESMSKIVSLLNYKPVGKQTSMLPVRITATLPENSDNSGQLTIPKFMVVNYNSGYVLKNDIITAINNNQETANIDTVLFQGSLRQTNEYTAIGDEFETILIEDTFIKNSDQFISDNFFIVYVNESGLTNGEWKEYTETASIFLESSQAEKYEKTFDEDYNYKFKFGNGIYGKKLPKGAKVVIYYIVSDGEASTVSDSTIQAARPDFYRTNKYNEILASMGSSSTIYPDGTTLTVTATGPSTEISLPESVESIRKNAPRIFASQNRLFSLADYKTFIDKNYSSYCKDSYFMTNDEYVSDFLRYYYLLGMSAPQKDSSINISQVEFMSSTNFNNIYAFLVPRVNTLINGRVPDRINTALKHEIVNGTKPYQGLNHNLVIMDPVYKAISFGSSALTTEFGEWDYRQISTKLVLIRSKLTKYSYTYMKDYCVATITQYFNNLTLGSTVDLAKLTSAIRSIPGLAGFYMWDVNGNYSTELTMYVWNPHYSNQDNGVTTQTIKCSAYTYPYFYDMPNLSSMIEVIDE